MEPRQFLLTIGSRDPERMVAFYRDVVGLTPMFEFAPGAFGLGSQGFPALIIEGHSEVEGAAGEPQRMLLNFLVDDVAGEQERLEGRGVEFIQAAYQEPGVGFFATFRDPDGNYCQLFSLS